MIDASLRDGKSYDDFLAAMKVVGCEVKRGKHLAFKIPGGKKFIRCDSLVEDYTEAAIFERLSGKRIVEPKQKTVVPVASAAKPNLLIDIQAKMQQGYGEGFRRWATVQNLKDASKTLIYLQEHELDDYGILTERAAAATARFNETSARIKEIDARLGEISVLQKHIGAHGKTRDVYRQYRESGWSKKFYAAHESEIVLHRAA